MECLCWMLEDQLLRNFFMGTGTQVMAWRLNSLKLSQEDPFVREISLGSSTFIKTPHLVHSFHCFSSPCFLHSFIPSPYDENTIWCTGVYCRRCQGCRIMYDIYIIWYVDIIYDSDKMCVTILCYITYL